MRAMPPGSLVLHHPALASVLLAALLPAAAAAQPAGRLGAFHEIAVAEDARRWSDGVLARYLADADPSVRARAALAAGRLQDSTSLAALMPLAADPDVEVRREAVFALGQIGHRKAGEALAARLGDDDLETVDLTLEALGKLGDRRWTARITEFLGYTSPLLRGEAAVALWRLADSTALEALIERHNDPDPEVRWRVVYALEKMPVSDRLALVVARSLDDESARVRAFAARALGRLRARTAAAYVAQALQDEDVDVAVNAARALGTIGDTLVLPWLEAALSHPHPHVRLTVAQALEQLAAPGAADSLAARLADPDAATRGACARALLRCAGGSALPRAAAVFEDTSVYARAAALEGLRYVPAAAALPRLRAGVAAGRDLLERITCATTLGALGSREGLDVLRPGLSDRDPAMAAACAEAVVALGDTASLAEVAAAYVQHLGDAEPDARQALRDALRELGGTAWADSVVRRHPEPPPRLPQYGPDFDEPPRARGAVLHTTAGPIEWEFFREEAPQTVKNFVALARRGYFNGLAFHRVVPAFVVQDGDPTGTGWGGPGYSIRCEYNRLRYEPGRVGMALSGKDTGGSQYFITLTPQMHLNGRYTIFARVTRGMEAAARLVQGDRVTSVEILE
jgi:cyclophilin family peptidyl-prolyl cis-trans isomerase/HEAT repeat protein